jgi:UDP-N-acetylglucosamine 1-carboxyvinyltransferase
MKATAKATTDRIACYVVEGGTALQGTVSVSGAKNAATKMLVASLLTEETCTLHNTPRIGDVTITESLLRALGAQVRWSPDHPATMLVTTSQVNTQAPPSELGRLNRLAVLTLGPMLHRCGQATIPEPGGDKIGPRPINFHIDGLVQMGAEIEYRDGHYIAKTKRLKGATIRLPFPSVGTTENLIITATLAKGVTIIENAAIEPEIMDLIKFLQKMGAIIELKVDRKIVVEGVERLHGATHRILPDRLEAVSLAIAAYLTKGDVQIVGETQDNKMKFLNTLYRIGLDFSVEEEGIRFFGDERPPRSIAIETDVHPGFMTDWQQPFTVLLTQARGMSVVHETIYEDRFGYTNELNRMGADTGLYSKCLGEVMCRFREKEYAHSCVVRGPTPLSGTSLTIPDIRAGCSYILASLCAQGTSTLTGIEHIERGYERLPEKLRGLGAKIEKVEGRELGVALAGQ